MYFLTWVTALRNCQREARNFIKALPRGPGESLWGDFAKMASNPSVVGGIGPEIAWLTLETHGNGIMKSSRDCGGLYAAKQTIEQWNLVCIAFGKEMNRFESPWPEIRGRDPSKSEFHKKSPEINVSTIDLDALKILAEDIALLKSYLDFSRGGERMRSPPLFSGSPR